MLCIWSKQYHANQHKMLFAGWIEMEKFFASWDQSDQANRSAPKPHTPPDNLCPVDPDDPVDPVTLPLDQPDQSDQSDHMVSIGSVDDPMFDTHINQLFDMFPQGQKKKIPPATRYDRYTELIAKIDHIIGTAQSIKHKYEKKRRAIESMGIKINLGTDVVYIASH